MPFRFLLPPIRRTSRSDPRRKKSLMIVDRFGSGLARSLDTSIEQSLCIYMMTLFRARPGNQTEIVARLVHPILFSRSGWSLVLLCMGFLLSHVASYRSHVCWKRVRPGVVFSML
jgi:hypothetical protein